MSPIYDPPPRPRRRAAYILAGSAALLVVLGVWLWGGRVTRGLSGGPGSAAPTAPADAPQGASTTAPASEAADPGAVIDTRNRQTPVLGEAPVGGASPSSAPAQEAGRALASPAARTSGTPATRGAPPSATADPRAYGAAYGASPPVPGPAGSAASGNTSGGARAASAGTAAPSGTTVLPPAVAPSARVAAGPANAPAPAQGNGADPSVRPEVWSPARPSGDNGDTTGTTGVDTPADQADRGTDRAPPVLDALSFEPPQIDDGGSARLLIHAHDDLAGIRSVTGNVRSPSARAVFAFEAAQADPNGSLYVATVTIPPKAETGSWYVAYLYVPDRADNALIVSYTPATVPPGGTLSVVSRESDSTAPVIHDIIITNATVQGGEHNHMRVDVDDDASGVASIVGSFKSPSGAALIPFVCRLNADTQTWEGDVTVPQSAECGQWIVHQILATDKAGNAAALQNPNPAIDHVGFQVVGSTCDDTPPVLEAFSMAPSSVSNDSAAEILVTASVSDAGSGATSLTGWATGPPATNGVTPKILFACVATNPSEPGSTWTGKILVPQYAAKGTWRITRVRVQDRAQNVRDYTQADGIIANATFTVQ